MNENLLGKISCSENCIVPNKNCFSCYYFDESPLADAAIEEIFSRFKKSGQLVDFIPKNGIGLVFVSSNEKYLLDNGELKKL